MGSTKKIQFVTLNVNHAEQVIKTIELFSSCFSDRERYTVKRLTDELRPSQKPFYRQFFIAESQGHVVGAGGVKALDWASHTHALYLSAVHAGYRGRGIGKNLIKLRLDWLKENYQSGRVIVSTAKIERFKQFGFAQVSETCKDGRALMLKEF